MLYSDKSLFDRDGLVTVFDILSSDVVDELHRRLASVFRGDYDSGCPPKYRTCSPDEIDKRLCRVSFPHLADPQIFDLVHSSGIGKIAAEILAASAVQAWFIHCIRKPPDAAGEPANVNYIGWHQDGQYTSQYFQGDFATLWISCGDVGPNDGPVHYVAGSHRSRLMQQHEGSGFTHTGGFDLLRERMREAVTVPWDEKVHLAPRGSATLHHSRLVHGSGVLAGDQPRLTLVMHLRTERNPLICPSLVQPRKEYSFSFDDTLDCPMLFGSSRSLRNERVELHPRSIS